MNNFNLRHFCNFGVSTFMLIASSTLITGCQAKTGIGTTSQTSSTILPPATPTPVSIAPILVTANESNDIASPLNSAIASCSGVDACTIEIAPASGTVILSAPVLINRDNVSVVCESSTPMKVAYYNTPLSPDGYYYGVLDIAHVTNASISGCTLDVSRLWSGLVAMHVYASTNITLSENVITSDEAPDFGAPLGIRAEGTADTPASNVTISDNFASVPSIAYSVGDNSQHVIFNANRSVGSYQCFDFNGEHGGVAPDAVDIQFTNGYCMNDIAPSYVESARNILIQGNTFQNDSTIAKGATIRVHNTLTSDPRLYVTISNNIFTGSVEQSTAIHVFQNAQYTTITNNTVQDYGRDGILLDSTAGTPLYVTVSGNTLANNGYSNGSQSYCAVRFHQSSGNNVGYVSLTANTYVYKQLGQTQVYGLCEDGGRTPFNITESGDLFVTLHFPDGCNACKLGL